MTVEPVGWTLVLMRDDGGASMVTGAEWVKVHKC